MTQPKHAILAGVLLLAVACAVTLVRWPRTPGGGDAPPEPVRPAGNAAGPQRIGGRSLEGATLAAAAGRLRHAKPGEATRVLVELRRQFTALPPREAGEAIRTFLDSQTDAPTGLGFRLGGGGALEEPPTLRAFLLDLLGELDPAVAAAYARVILSRMDSPDEWALALRNLARGDTSADARALLEQKTGELLRHEPWQQNPSSGYLEAFDAAVHWAAPISCRRSRTWCGNRTTRPWRTRRIWRWTGS